MTPIRLFRDSTFQEARSTEDYMDEAMKKIDESLGKARDIGWNQAIDECCETVERFLRQVPGLAEPLIEKLKSLKK